MQLRLKASKLLSWKINLFKDVETQNGRLETASTQTKPTSVGFNKLLIGITHR
jgi:hypothetical protein